MVKQFGIKKKYFLILTMLTIAFCILVYIVKKIVAKRTSYLIELGRSDEAGHGESAILEEQSAILEEKEVKTVDDMKVDLTQYIEYRKYEPEVLWDIYNERFTKNKSLQKCFSKEDDSFPPARLEILLYYQTFVQLFRMHVENLSNLQCFKSNDAKSIKLKVNLRKMSASCFEDTTSLYEFQEDFIGLDDKFSFNIKYKDLSQYIIYVSLWMVNVFHHEILLGAAHIDLSNYSDYTTKQVIASDIVPVKKDLNIYGHLLVALCYLPEVERLICVVMSGKAMKDDITNLSFLDNVLNPFVDVFLINDGKIIKRHSTQIILDDKNPVFNEAFEFYIPSHQVCTSDIYLIAMHKYNRITNTLIGKLMIGNHSDGEQKRHWNEALSKPETLIPKWYPLTR